MYFPVVDVSGWDWAPPVGITGAREKLRVWHPDTRKTWIFKEPLAGTGEHWMEKAACEIGTLCGLEMAGVELSRRGDRLGILMKEFDAAPREAGVDLLSEQVEDYLMAAHHTYQRIRRILRPLGETHRLHGMMILDALIGNLDRHDENWELVRRERLAPVYDNGNCEIARLTPAQQQKAVEDPAEYKRRFENVQSAIGWEEEEGDFYLPSLLRLMDALAETHPEEWDAALRPFLDVPIDDVQAVFDRISPEFISEPCRLLARQMVAERMGRLRGIASA